MRSPAFQSPLTSATLQAPASQAPQGKQLYAPNGRFQLCERFVSLFMELSRPPPPPLWPLWRGSSSRAVQAEGRNGRRPG